MGRKLWMTLVLVVLACLGAGCGATPLNISVQLDQSFKDKYGMAGTKEVLVDIVGVKGADDEAWRKASMTEYSAHPDDNKGLRATEMRKTITLKTSDLSPQVLTADDGMWKLWLKDASEKQPTRIYVLVQMPGVHDAKEDKPGDEDARRAVLSTQSGDYKRGMFDPAPTVHLVITASGKQRQ